MPSAIAQRQAQLQPDASCVGIDCVPKHGTIALTTASTSYLCLLNNWLLRAREATDVFLVAVLLQSGGNMTQEAQFGVESRLADVGNMTVVWCVAMPSSHWQRLA